MSKPSDGPLPQWTPLAYGGPWEAPAPDGTVWRLRAEDAPSADDPFPVGYRLAPRDDLGNVTFITGDGGLYEALDMAGLHITGDGLEDG